MESKVEPFIVSRSHDSRETILKSLYKCHCCFGCGAGAGGAGLKHCNKNAVYKTNAIDKAINAYMNILSSGCLNLFFRSHSSTSSSFMRSPAANKIIVYDAHVYCNSSYKVFKMSEVLPLNMLGNRFLK